MSRPRTTTYYTNRHACYLLNYHIVLVTKYRHPVLTGDVKNIIYDTIKTILKEKGLQLLEINGEPDHVHILINADFKTDLPQLMNIIKTKTARFARKSNAEYLSQYYWEPVFWSDSYFITTTGPSEIKVVQEYIKNQ